MQDTKATWKRSNCMKCYACSRTNCSLRCGENLRDIPHDCLLPLFIDFSTGTGFNFLGLCFSTTI